MGCASSSPLVTSNNGGVMDVVKGAATDAVHTGEEVLNDVKDAFTDTVGNVKEAVVGAVQNVGTGIENALGGNKIDESNSTTITNNNSGNNSDDVDKLENMIINNKNENETDYKIIPLKDPNDKLNDMMKTDLTTKIHNNINDEAEKLTDEFIKETEDVMENIENTMKINNNIEKKNVTVTPGDNNKLLMNRGFSQSIDSLKTNSPDPEIENAMANKNDDDDLNDPPTPKPTYSELEQLQKASSAVIESVAKNASQVTLTDD